MDPMNFSTVIIILFACSINLAQVISFPEEKNDCRTHSGGKGFCLPLKSCPRVVASIKKGVTPVHCGFNGHSPIVCCPLIGLGNNNLTERITKLGVEPPTVDFECGIRGFVTVLEKEEDESFVGSGVVVDSAPQGSRRKRSSNHVLNKVRRVKRRPDFKITVVGGITAKKNSWPWMALLGRETGSVPDFFCSSVLINENFVLTAAHCVLSLDPFFVRLGEHDYGRGFGKPLLNTVEDVGVEQILFHPDFNLNQGYHDVALLKLNATITFKNEVSPICLPWDNLSFEELLGKKVTVAGWGNLSFGGRQSTALQEVNVTVFDSSVCEESYSTLSDFGDVYPNGMSNENVICAGDIDGTKDACEGDSGGPIMFFDPKLEAYYVTGVISKGYGCGLKEFPGLYSPVRDDETLKWIKRTAF